MTPPDIMNSNAATSRSRTSLTKALTRAALGGLLLVAAGASHAEKGQRICGITAVGSTWNNGVVVGFVMKVNKEDSWSCDDAIKKARAKFDEVGWNSTGANRIWRRLHGGKSGPFGQFGTINHPKRTCESFTAMHPHSIGCDSMVGDGGGVLYTIAGNKMRAR